MPKTIPDSLLMEGDIFLTKGDSFISRAIRFFSRTGGEARTEVNHTGMITSMGNQNTASIVEALTTVKKRMFVVYSGSKNTAVWVYRPINIPNSDVATIAEHAESYVGKKYGYGKIVAHFLDWLIGGRYFFRRFARMDKYPICSWVVAYSYSKAGYDFGVHPGAASPDDIHDFVVANPEKYKLVYQHVPI